MRVLFINPNLRPGNPVRYHVALVAPRFLGPLGVLAVAAGAHVGVLRKPEAQLLVEPAAATLSRTATSPTKTPSFNYSNQIFDMGPEGG